MLARFRGAGYFTGAEKFVESVVSAVNALTESGVYIADMLAQAPRQFAHDRVSEYLQWLGYAWIELFGVLGFRIFDVANNISSQRSI